MLQYIIDSFSDRIFSGNPAAVVICDSFLDENLMQKIASENNLSESAFLFMQDAKNTFDLQFFTPKNEIDLCGHATLASGFVVMNLLKTSLNEVHFKTKSGMLKVAKKRINNKDLFEMNFPIFAMSEVEISTQIRDAISPLNIIKVLKGRDLLCIVDSPKSVLEFLPDMEKIARLDGLLLHISASLDSKNCMESRLLGELKNKKVDCISRTFAPKCGVSEDPVCGSGHCHIAPFFANALGKNQIIAYQASSRGGFLYTKMLYTQDSNFQDSMLQDCIVKDSSATKNHRILISGEATLFSKAEIFV